MNKHLIKAQANMVSDVAKIGWKRKRFAEMCVNGFEWLLFISCSATILLSTICAVNVSVYGAKRSGGLGT